MKEFLIGAAAIVIAGAAIAQAPVASPAPHAAPHAMAPKADKIHTRDQMVAKVRDHFARLDADKDGFLTKAEAEAGNAAVRQKVVEKMGEKRDPNAAFDRLDANKDGAISRDEFAQAREKRVERRTVMKERAGAAPGAEGHKGMRMHRMGGMMMGGQMFDMADANKDGRVSLQEATDAAARHFDMADANRDGQVTPDERRQMHRQMMEKHRAPKVG